MSRRGRRRRRIYYNRLSISRYWRRRRRRRRRRSCLQSTECSTVGGGGGGGRKFLNLKSRFDLKFINSQSRCDPRNTSRVYSQHIEWRRRRWWWWRENLDLHSRIDLAKSLGQSGRWVFRASAARWHFVSFLTATTDIQFVVIQ